jgi:hypothetical protein
MQKDNLKNETPTDANNVLVADAVKMKLTPRQNMIIFCLQNGWSLITQSQTNIVTCCSSKGQFEFNSSLLFRFLLSLLPKPAENCIFPVEHGT